MSRVTTIKGLYVTDLCEDKIAVGHNVVTEMKELRTERKLQLCISPLYKINDTVLKICYLNARSLHKHIDDVREDFNFSSTDISIIKVVSHPNLTSVGIYRSPKVPISELCSIVTEIMLEIDSDEIVIVGDFNVNWLNEIDRRSLYNVIM